MLIGQAELAADNRKGSIMSCSAQVPGELVDKLTSYLLLEGEGEQSPMRPQAPFVVDESPFLKPFIKKLTRECVVQTISARVCWLTSAARTSTRIVFQDGVATKESARAAFRWNTKSDPRSFPRFEQCERGDKR
jgi:hypothetical protein